jgi:predicted RND superfamily exporter protein
VDRPRRLRRVEHPARVRVSERVGRRSAASGILITAIWTIGTIGWAGRPINLVTASVPALLVAIGFAYATYVVAEYQETLRAAEKEGDRNLTDVTRRAVAAILLPALVASITTIQGFGSLAFTNITAVREFGLFSAAGVFYAFLIGVTFTPATLRLLGTRRPSRERAEGFLERFAERIARFDLRHSRAILLGAVVVFAVALAGALRLEVGSDYITQFPADSRIRRDFQAINQHLGGVSSLYVVIESSAPDAFAEPENLRELRSLQDWLRAQPEVGSAVSVVDYLMLLNRGMHDNDPAFLAIPDSERLVKQLLLFGSTDELDRFVAADYGTANIVARANVLDSRPSLELTRRIEERLALLPAHLQGRVTGGVVLLGESTENIARGQVKSLGAALAGIYLMISLMLTSLRVGLIALIPNVLPVVVFFAALGYTDTQLSVSVSLVGSMALGIAVDDSVHYFARFNSESRRLGSEEKATISTLRASIRPATTTMLGLCVGFLLVGQSSLRAQQEFGMLAAFTMAVGWVAELLLTPALGASTRIVTLWDLLTLDLGKDPHRAIPLFSGLSVRQARMVALLADVVEVPAGTFLLREGEPGGDMYVVVEGTLRSSVRRNGKRVEFSTSSRGDVLGEFALFGGVRTADVETLTDTRLIRIEAEDLERIRRRSPRTASIVLRNLNRIQAERMASTVARVG